MIYLDNSATTKPCAEAVEAMMQAMTEKWANPSALYNFGIETGRQLRIARHAVAAAMGAEPDRVFFTSGGTEADNWALIGGAYAAKERGKNKILLSAIEHHAVLYAAKALEMQGFSVTYLPVSGTGRVEPNVLKESIREDTGLVCGMAANNETGVLQPIQELAGLAHERGALFFTDAVQAAPYTEIDVNGWGVDMLSLSAHKFYGPKGCGVLYIKESVKAENILFGGEQERGRRGGTTNVPAVVGMAAAYEKSCRELQTRKEKLAALRKAFLQSISALDGVKINGEEGLPAILNLQI